MTQTAPADTTVLVTGASGFIAQHTIVALLAAGYRVRGTVRSLKRADEIRRVVGAQIPVGDRLTLVEAELTSDDGWREACRGCRFVLHMASPLPPRPPKHPDELIVPARDGALRVLRAAVAERVRRVVMTSSVAAVLYGHARDGSRTYDERDWSQLSSAVGAYEQSKTIAERAAWDFVEALPADQRIELVTVNPGLVLGPVLSADFSTSGEGPVLAVGSVDGSAGVLAADAAAGASPRPPAGDAGGGVTVSPSLFFGPSRRCLVNCSISVASPCKSRCAIKRPTFI